MTKIVAVKVAISTARIEDRTLRRSEPRQRTAAFSCYFLEQQGLRAGSEYQSAL